MERHSAQGCHRRVWYETLTMTRIARPLYRCIFHSAPIIAFYQADKGASKDGVGLLIHGLINRLQAE